MKALELNLQDEVYDKLHDLASHDHQSVHAFAIKKLEELARAFEDFKLLEERSRRGDRDKFLSAMGKVPDAPPVTGDEL